jgi:hypothetical protein
MKNVKHPNIVMKGMAGVNVSAVVMQVSPHGVASVWRKSDDKQ